MSRFAIDFVSGLTTAGSFGPNPGLVVSSGFWLGWFALAVPLAAVAGFIVSLVAVWKNRTAETRKARGRAIFGVILSWSMLCVLCAAIFLPTDPPIQSPPHKVHAQKTATELRTALMSYYSEYKRFPAVPGATKDGFGDDLVDTRNHLLVELLIGDSGPATALNRRRIQFFSCRPAKHPTSQGLWRDPASGRCHLLDPWGNPYFLLIDANLDNTLRVPARSPALGKETIFTNLAVWSLGKDGRLGGGDDVSAY